MYKIESGLDLFYENTVVNWHEHVWAGADGEFDPRTCDEFVGECRACGFDRVVVSLPVTSGEGAPEEYTRRYNDIIARAVERHPGYLAGMGYVNPGHGRLALDEIDRCVNELGFVGIKLYNQYFISDPIVRPVIEKCISLDIPILEHAGKLMWHPESQMYISDGTHFARAAREYPEATLIMAHIGGGGDWEWSLKALAHRPPNVFTDISGSVYDTGLIELTAQVLGADNMLFGTDRSLSAGMGKLIGADMPRADKITILNNPRFSRYLERGR